MNALKKSCILIIALCLFVSKEVYGAPLKDIERTEISPGVVRREVRATVGGRNHIVDVIEVDLKNPYASLEVMAGAGGYTRKDTVSHMADRTGAFAAVNGDFFNMNKQGAPFGPSVVEGKLQTSPLESVGLYAFGIDGNRKAHIESFTFSGGIYASDGASYPIKGLNKTDYIINHTQIPSHKDSIQLYNDFWTSPSRGLKGSGEVLVAGDGRVEKISLDGPLPMATPKGKFILQVNGRAKDFIRKHVAIGDAVRIDYRISPDRDWKFLIGGHALLVENARPAIYTLDAAALDGRRARTAAAISKDGKKVYLLATEGRNKKTPGMRLAEWAATVASFGVETAVNLDGGGSTTMVARENGDFKNTVVARPEKGAPERYIVNGIGVMNTAPRGKAKDGEIEGPRGLIVGEVANYRLKKAWDEYFHPLHAASLGYSLSDSRFGDEAWVYSRFLSPDPGKTDVVLTFEHGRAIAVPVTIYDASKLKQLSFNVTESENRISLAPRGKTAEGRVVELDPDQMNWNVQGAEVAVDTQSWKVPGENGIRPPAATFTTGEGKTAYLAIDARFGKERATYFKEFPGYRKVAMTVGKTAYTADGSNKTMDTTPIIERDRTLVPLRFLLESYGARVDWRNEDRTAVVNYRGSVLELPADEDRAILNGRPLDLDVGSMLRDDRTLIPLRFVTETFGMQVYYDEATRGVAIYERQ